MASIRLALQLHAVTAWHAQVVTIIHSVICALQLVHALCVMAVHLLVQMQPTGKVVLEIPMVSANHVHRVMMASTGQVAQGRPLGHVSAAEYVLLVNTTPAVHLFLLVYVLVARLMHTQQQWVHCTFHAINALLEITGHLL